MVPWSDIPLTWGDQLAHAERLLVERAGAAAREEALRLLGALLGEPLTLVLARPTTPMRLSDAEAYAGWIARRVAGEAIPHITGRLAFMGLDLTVEPGSPLVSPAAQRLVEVALECARYHSSGELPGGETAHGHARYRAPGELSGAHLGAGCGAVALALGTFEPRFARIYAVDPSLEALRVAAANGARYLLNLVIDWREGDGLDAVPEPVDMIICDLFAPSGLRSAAQTPAASSQVERLFEQASAKLRPDGALLCALDGALESEALTSLARALPAARIWTAPSSGAVVIVAAQASRSAAGLAGDAAFGA